MTKPANSSAMGCDASSVDFSKYEFAPVIELPVDYEVYDFSVSYDPNRPRKSLYGIGRYNERRPGMYKSELFKADPVAARDIHIGIDIASPPGTAISAFYDGRIFLSGVNSATGDYGGTIITEHRFDGRTLWALHGHLSTASAVAAKPGIEFRRGDKIGTVGEESENGGWNPHLHFQLSWRRPERCDMPGVVNQNDLLDALSIYPDPRLVLGPLYK